MTSVYVIVREESTEEELLDQEVVCVATGSPRELIRLMMDNALSYTDYDELKWRMKLNQNELFVRLTLKHDELGEAQLEWRAVAHDVVELKEKVR